MSQAEKDAVDAAALAASVSSKETDLKSRLFPTQDLIAELAITCTASGLVISCASQSLDIADTFAIVADPNEIKFVRVILIYNSASDTFLFQAYEKTSQEFAGLGADEFLMVVLKQWSLAVNGAALVEV